MNPYGFDWGPMSVERLAHVDGKGYALEVKTRHARLQIYVSEKGRKIEAYPLGPYKKQEESAWAKSQFGE
jgi:hypothetical protein